MKYSFGLGGGEVTRLGAPALEGFQASFAVRSKWDFIEQSERHKKIISSLRRQLEKILTRNY